MHATRLLLLAVASVAARRSSLPLPRRAELAVRCPAQAGACVEEQDGARTAALRLRGGDLATMLEGAQSSYLGVPVVTRTWATIIVSLALLSQVGLLAPEVLAMDGALVVKKLQLWRIVTSSSFFGGIGAQLLQKMYYLISFGQALEVTIGSGEYLRVIASCIAVHAFIFHLLGWQFLGEGLIMAITVLFAQLSPPGATMSLYGLKIPYPLLPFAQLAMSYLFTQQVPYQDIAGLLVGYMHYFMNDNLKPDDAVQIPAAAKKGGRASAAGQAKGNARRRGGRKGRVSMNMAASN